MYIYNMFVYIRGNMSITITNLRQRIFKEIDKIITTGKPLEIERNGHKLKIILESKKSKLNNLITRKDIIKCSDEELIYNNWLKDWKHETPDD